MKPAKPPKLKPDDLVLLLPKSGIAIVSQYLPVTFDGLNAPIKR